MTGDASYPMAGRDQPSRAEVAGHPRLTVIDNHLGTTLLGRLRDRKTSVSDFNETASELARLVLYAACRDLPVAPHMVEGFSGDLIEVEEPAERIAAVAILRAGLVFQPAFHIVLPSRPLYHLGIKRNEETLEPQVYVRNIPETEGWADRVLILDPMLATGGTAAATIEIVRGCHRGALDVLCLVAAPLGVQTVLEADDRTRVITLALDDRLNDQGFIVPGLGDAGDRYFGTLSQA